MKNKTNEVMRILELTDRVHVVNVFVEPTTEEELQELEHAKEIADRELLEFVKLCKIYVPEMVELLKEADGWLCALGNAGSREICEKIARLIYTRG